jgi:hypothetical protein
MRDYSVNPLGNWSNICMLSRMNKIYELEVPQNIALGIRCSCLETRNITSNRENPPESMPLRKVYRSNAVWKELVMSALQCQACVPSDQVFEILIAM